MVNTKTLYDTPLSIYFHPLLSLNSFCSKMQSEIPQLLRVVLSYNFMNISPLNCTYFSTVIFFCITLNHYFSLFIPDTRKAHETFYMGLLYSTIRPPTAALMPLPPQHSMFSFKISPSLSLPVFPIRGALIVINTQPLAPNFNLTQTVL